MPRGGVGAEVICPMTGGAHHCHTMACVEGSDAKFLGIHPAGEDDRASNVETMSSRDAENAVAAGGTRLIGGANGCAPPTNVGGGRWKTDIYGLRKMPVGCHAESTVGIHARS